MIRSLKRRASGPAPGEVEEWTGQSGCLGFSIPLLLLRARGRGTAVTGVLAVLVDLQHLPSTGEEPAAQGHDMIGEWQGFCSTLYKDSLGAAIRLRRCVESSFYLSAWGHFFICTPSCMRRSAPVQARNEPSSWRLAARTRVPVHKMALFALGQSQE